MAQVKNILKVMQVLIDAGMGEEFIEADHDVIYILPAEKESLPETELGKKLEEAGAYFDESQDTWIMHC